MIFFNLLVGKFTSGIIRSIFHRNGSTWPGHLAIEANPNFINDVLVKNKHLKIVLIAGTNGKTTTTKALHQILDSNNISAARNASGANLVNGFASLIIKEADLTGKIKNDALLFEVDENSLPLLLETFSNLTYRQKRGFAPGVQISLVLLNLFRDQLDRYGELNTTAEKWKEALKKMQNIQIIANSDDPQIVNITSDLKNVSYFTIDNSLKTEKTLAHAVDSTTCPKCQSDLAYLNISYSHIGTFKCPKCGFTNPKGSIYNIKTNLKGNFNLYNLAAAILTSERVFNLTQEMSIKSLANFEPAFGRQEEIEYKGKKIKVLLSKNPTGFNESLKVVKENKYTNLLILLNDRIPDGRDISWIWDVDFENISRMKLNTTISGDRTYDMANRLRYADVESKPIENLDNALVNALKQTPKEGTLIILPTYSAMLEVRKILTGKALL